MLCARVCCCRATRCATRRCSASRSPSSVCSLAPLHFITRENCALAVCCAGVNFAQEERSAKQVRLLPMLLPCWLPAARSRPVFAHHFLAFSQADESLTSALMLSARLKDSLAQMCVLRPLKVRPPASQCRQFRSSQFLLASFARHANACSLIFSVACSGGQCVHRSCTRRTPTGSRSCSRTKPNASM